MNEKRFSLKEWEDLNYCEHCFYDGESQLSDSDVVDLLNDQQATIQRMKHSLNTIYKAFEKHYGYDMRNAVWLIDKLSYDEIVDELYIAETDSKNRKEASMYWKKKVDEQQATINKLQDKLFAMQHTIDNQENAIFHLKDTDDNLRKKNIKIEELSKVVHNLKMVLSNNDEQVAKIVGEQQATISQLQDLCGESDSKNAKLRIENEQLRQTMQKVCELLEEEVDLFSNKATEHDVIAYREMQDFDNKDAYYICTATKKAIQMLKGRDSDE